MTINEIASAVTRLKPEQKRRLLVPLRALLVVAMMVPCLAQRPALIPVGVPYFTRESVVPVWGTHVEPLRPGMLVAIYGRSLAPVGGCGAGYTVPLRPPYPTELCGVTVTVAGKRAGLLAVLDTQINLQVPEGIPSSGQAPIQVTVGVTRSTPVIVDFGPPIVTLSTVAPAYVGMPVWIRLERPHPYDTYYPYSTDPWNFGGGEFEVRREGVPVKSRRPGRSPFGGVGRGLLNGSSAPAGSPRSRLPLHLVVAFDRPGSYAIRFTGHRLGFDRTGIQAVETDRSEWFEFEVRPLDRERRDAWLLDLKSRMSRGTAGELAGDLLPSALASPGEWLIPILLDLTHWSDAVTPRTEHNRPSIEHGEQIVQRYAAECLHAFDEQVVWRHAADYARQYGPSPAMVSGVGHNREWLDEAALRKGLGSREGWAQAGALEAINAMQTRTNDRDVIDAADRILKINNREAVTRLARVLGLIHTDESRRLLWRIVESGSQVSEQALICIAWIANGEDLPRLGAELLKYDAADPYGYRKSSLPYQLDKQFGERSYPYLRRAVGESRQLWVRKAAALPLARRGDAAAFATLLDIIVKQPSAQLEICEFARNQFPELKSADDAEVLAFLRAKAGR